MLTNVWLLGVLGCQGGGSSTPPMLAVGPSTAVGDAPLIGAVDFDGDGVDERVRLFSDELRWLNQRAPLNGGVQRIARGVLNGADGERLFVGLGLSRRHPKANAEVWSVGPSGVELLWAGTGPRAQITELEVIHGRLWLCAFQTQREVSCGWVKSNGWAIFSSGPLAMHQLPINDAVAVGRLYGDTPRSDGDLRVKSGGGERTLPGFRGVRAMAVADLNSDGLDELLVADGWHASYGERAVARVQLYQEPLGERTVSVVHLPDDYTVDQIDVWEGLLLLTTPSAFYVVQRGELGWTPSRVAARTSGANAVWTRSESGLGVLIGGKPAHFYPLRPMVTRL